MKKLPIGIQTFSKIIEGDFVYIDKTKHAYDLLVNSGGVYFLSRPRRFGKSLFLDTLKDIFEGRKELFKGLYIEDKWDFEDKYPVLKISFGCGVGNSKESLHKNIIRIFRKVQQDLGLSCMDKTDVKGCFEYLIQSAYAKYNKKVVILIDEYDKPILDNITNSKVAELMRNELREFYSVIKENDQYIRLVFLTGVSKFSKMSLFSGLNNLEDITLDARYATICGYTQNEMESAFANRLKGVDLGEVKKWYNGYNFLGDKVYNPFDVLLFLSKGCEFKNYWWSTGSPKFLVDILYSKDYSIPKIENFKATGEMLDSFDVDTIHLEALLWQTGYLTIKEKYREPFGIKYLLGVPNLEVQTSLNNLFITSLTKYDSETIEQRTNLVRIFESADLSRLKNVLFTLFAGIPYHNFTNNKIAHYEGYYASIIYAYFASLGLETIAEDTTNKGRVDMTLRMNGRTYIFEFKLSDEATNHPMQQIKERKYYEKYLDSREIYLIGIEFSRSERNIINFVWERFEH